MIIDTSALIAVLFAEPEGPELFRTIRGADGAAMSAASLLEFWIVTDGRGTATQRRLADRYRRELGIHAVPVTASQVEIARDAYREFGRGSGHPAQLNFGDCFSYALAIEQDEPLLWVGDDFGHTDVRRAR